MKVGIFNAFVRTFFAKYNKYKHFSVILIILWHILRLEQPHHYIKMQRMSITRVAIAVIMHNTQYTLSMQENERQHSYWMNRRASKTVIEMTGAMMSARISAIIFSYKCWICIKDCCKKRYSVSSANFDEIKELRKSFFLLTIRRQNIGLIGLDS